MPRFPDRNLDGVVFLYPTVECARKRERIGGTGFYVGRELKGAEAVYGQRKFATYLVSNRHVVFEGGACVMTINRKDGGEPDIVELDQNDWVAHPRSDLAAISLSTHRILDTAIHRVVSMMEYQFATPEIVARDDVGVGEEVVMVGRFINLQTTPAVRFGSISAMPTPIKFGAPWPHTEECYAAEMRSRTGFSGSPVMVYRTLVSVLADLPDGAEKHFYRLLGVNCGYIKDHNEKGEEENTWLNAVIPAWRITELLDLPALRNDHEAQEALVLAIAAAVKARLEPPA